jgi:hypothetical protein
MTIADIVQALNVSQDTTVCDVGQVTVVTRKSLRGKPRKVTRVYYDAGTNTLSLIRK